MHIRSLSYSTLLYRLSGSSNIEDKGAYLVITTPGLPFYHWGNFLLFPNPPDEGDFNRWRMIFGKEFENTACSHSAFAWDSPDGAAGEIAPFLNDGYYFEYDEILMTQRETLPLHYRYDVEIRPLITTVDWEKRIALNLACDPSADPGHLREAGMHFLKDVERDRGLMMVAFLSGDMVGEAALFRGGEQRGLVSMVKTHPAHRGQGICRTLIHDLLRCGREQFRFRDFVVVADKRTKAARVYRSVGFKLREHGASLIKIT